MDTRAYMPAFLAEAHEHLTDLGLAVVRIEAAPADHLAAEGVFRIAHSLKGMSATMGFDAIATLTHAMEDVFELLRQRSGGLPPEAIDVLSACLDALEAAVESIAANGEERLDPEPLVARLQVLARGRTPSQELARDGDVLLADLPVGPVAPAPAAALDARVLHVVADLADDCTMPAVRAFMLFEALRVHGELVGGVPDPDAVERFAGRRVEAWVATTSDEQVLADSARAVGELVEVAVRAAQRPGDEPAAPAAPAALPKRPAEGSQDEPDPGRSSEGGAAAPSGERRRATVRVDAERLDELLHLTSELVQHRTAVEALAADPAAAAVPGLAQAVQRLARTSQALQTTVTRARMVPVESVFLRFPRLVRDLATRLGKQVELRLVGEDTELDRSVVDALGDPLVHLVRNALDHGLELPAERVAAGKGPTGVLELAARHAGGHVIVSVRDDGRGIDTAAVARVALERGLLDAEAAAALDPAGAAELLFQPGFSTAPTTTELSGRGVGMDAVRNGVRALGGEVTLTSGFRPPVTASGDLRATSHPASGDLRATSQGTIAQLRLPLTLASISALLVTVDGLAFAIPLDRVVRTVRLADHPVRTVRGAPLLPLGEELLPLLDAAAALGQDRTPAPTAQRPALGSQAERKPGRLPGSAPAPDPAPARTFAVVIATAAGHRDALAVSALAGQRELVTRRLPREVSARAAAAGGAVLPDGGIALVVDCDAVAAATAPPPPSTSTTAQPAAGPAS